MFIFALKSTVSLNWIFCCCCPNEWSKRPIPIVHHSKSAHIHTHTVCKYLKSQSWSGLVGWQSILYYYFDSKCLKGFSKLFENQFIHILICYGHLNPFFFGREYILYKGNMFHNKTTFRNFWHNKNFQLIIQHDAHVMNQ